MGQKVKKYNLPNTTAARHPDATAAKPNQPIST